MRRRYLEEIVIHLPAAFRTLLPDLVELLAPWLRRSGDRYVAVPSNEDYLPGFSLDSECEAAFGKADFVTSFHEWATIYIKDITGIERRNPAPYRPIELNEVHRRFMAARVEVLGIDHIGFNLPWFGDDLHPAVWDLRSRLKDDCLYHRFPGGEPWDFIIPGNKAEIAGRRAVDYNLVRRPKFEIVSFNKASTPLVQIDLLTSAKHEQLIQLFPEALDGLSARNAWIYLSSDCAIDLCLVANEAKDKDWSSFFRGHRIR